MSEVDCYEKWMRKRLGYDLEEEFEPSKHRQEKMGLLLNFGKYKRQRLDIIAWNDPAYLKWAWNNIREKLPYGVKEFIRDMKDEMEEDIKNQDKQDEW